MVSSMDEVVVYIEDEPEMIEMVRITLESYGYSLLGTTRGDDGIELVKRVKPNAVLLDLLMPEVDGWKVYRELKWDSETEDIPIIVITAKAQPQDVIERQFRQGIEGYIVKPFGPYEIVKALEKVSGKDRRPAEHREDRLPPRPGAEEAKGENATERDESGAVGSAVPRGRTENNSRSAYVPKMAKGNDAVRRVANRKNGTVRSIKKVISFFVAVIYLLRYAASFISSSFKERT